MPPAGKARSSLAASKAPHKIRRGSVHTHDPRGLLQHRWWALFGSVPRAPIPGNYPAAVSALAPRSPAQGAPRPPRPGRPAPAPPPGRPPARLPRGPRPPRAAEPPRSPALSSAPCFPACASGAAEPGLCGASCPSCFDGTETSSASRATVQPRPDTPRCNSALGASRGGTCAHNPSGVTGERVVGAGGDVSAELPLELRSILCKALAGPREVLSPERLSLGVELLTLLRGAFLSSGLRISSIGRPGTIRQSAASGAAGTRACTLRCCQGMSDDSPQATHGQGRPRPIQRISTPRGPLRRRTVRLLKPRRRRRSRKLDGGRRRFLQRGQEGRRRRSGPD